MSEARNAVLSENSTIRQQQYSILIFLFKYICLSYTQKYGVFQTLKLSKGGSR